MVDFSYRPPTYYVAPGTNGAGIPPRPVETLAAAAAVGVVNGINAATYDPSPFVQTSDTIGYRLPAQNYVNYGPSSIAQFGTPSLKTALINTAVNVGINAVGNALGLNNPSGMRLRNNGLNYGATPSQGITSSSGSSSVAFSDNTETRVILYDNTGLFINQSDILAPLQQIGGVLFPYTPAIQFAHKANYEIQHLVHTNYGVPQYSYSSVDNIGLTADFTANTPAEAEYIVAVIHFFRSVTKMFYGQDQAAGTPPPVLYLNGHGPFLMDLIPVVVSSFDYSLPTDVDYISCSVAGEKQRVPTQMSVQVSMIPTYSRNNISNNFGLTEFSNGGLIVGSNGSSGAGGGGWL
jgi:hypothetical protein